MYLLYTLQKICAVYAPSVCNAENLLRQSCANMCYMLSDINVMRIALMCKEAWLYARGTYLILVNTFIMH